MSVLVIGGKGLVARELVSQLIARGCLHLSPAVLTRSPITVPGARVIVGHYAELAARPEFQRQLRSFDAVVHLADGLPLLQDARFGAQADELIDGSERLVAAVRASGVKLFLYLSSIKAIANEDDQRLLTETCEPRSSTVYGHAKWRLEQLIETTLRGSVTRHVILRNPVIYGCGSYGSLGRLLDLASTRWPLPLGGLKNRRSLISIRNLGSALVAVLSKGGEESGVFHLHDGAPLSTTEIVSTYRAALGQPARLIQVPIPLARLLCATTGLRPLARRLFGSLEVSDERFRHAFGWSALETSKAALTDMARCEAAHRRAAVADLVEEAL